GLIDEIYPPTTSPSFRDASSFMYLIDTEKDTELGVADFTTILQRYIQHGQTLYESTIRFSIPDLLVRLCPQEGIRLATARKLLTAWISNHRQDAAIERPSIG